MTAKTLLAGLTTASAIALLAQTASAQTMDYNQAEEMFGEPVTTSALGIPQRASAAPTTMTIITQDEIRRSGVRDIIELLARVPGVDIQRTAVMDGDVGIRGYNQAGASRILVMVNGRQVYVDHQAYMVWAALPVALTEIRQIEIVRGPNTALFGFNAVDGVINIITNNPLLENANAAEVTVGTQARREVTATKTVKFGDWGGLRLSTNMIYTDGFKAERKDRNDLRTYATTATNKWDYGKPFRQYFGADGLFQLTPDLQVGVEGTHTRAETNMRVSNQTVTTPEGRRDIVTGTPYWSIQSGKTYFAWNNGWGTTKGQFYVTRNGSWSGPRTDYRTNNNMVGQLEQLFKLNATNSFRTSLEARRTDYSTEPRNAGTSAAFEGGYNLFAASGSWLWQMTDALSLATAARLDVTRSSRWGALATNVAWAKEDYFQTKKVYGYNAALSYVVSDDTTVRLSTARGVQYPNLINLLNTNGNPYLDPGAVTSYELGLVQNLPLLNAQATANLFYNQSKDLYSTSRAGIGGRQVRNGRTYSVSDSIGDSEVVGLELSLKGTVGHYRWGINYTFLNTNDDLLINTAVNPVTGTGYTTNVSFEDTNVPHSGNINLGYANGPWELDLYLNYVGRSKQFSPPTSFTIDNDFPARVGLSGRIGYAVNENVTLAVSGSNFNKDQILLATNRPVDRQVFGTVTVKW